MQVDFDSTYLNEDNEAQKKLKSRNKLVSSHKQIITEVRMEDAQDYEALTTLYRKIFKFLLEFTPNSRASDKGVEREVAAALESVFPRVGLKAFIQLNDTDKQTQVMELARIVLGIRLFNREEGRGGAGIDRMDTDAIKLSNVLLADIEKEIEYFNDACDKYQKAIVRAYLYRRKKKFLVKEVDRKLKEAEEEGIPQHHRHGLHTSEMFLISQLEDVNDYVIERWSQELANRRQYLTFLHLLRDEMCFIQQKVFTQTEKLRSELVTVKGLVSNKSSVPKEVVYPRFEAIGQIWSTLYDEVVIMVARSNTFQALNRYRLSFSPTLADELHGDEEPKEVSLHGDGTQLFRLESTKTGMTTARTNTAKTATTDGSVDMITADEKLAFEERKFNEDNKNGPDKEEEDGLPSPIDQFGNTQGKFIATGAVLLTPENTPDFTLLPLELQGYCPWTIVEARGLLLPGKPHLGIIRYENRYYVFDHPLAVNAFMTDPDRFLNGIKDQALRNPEYIHLLKLQRWFPTTSIRRLMEKHEQEVNNFSGQPLTKDAATETPTHFQDGYIDLNYHWNEWELRRRALKVVNMYHCKTTGMQTDKSHFRRENESQVYLAIDSDAQTKRDKRTNPPIVTTYVEGLRGMVIAGEKTSTNDSSNSSTARGAGGGELSRKSYSKEVESKDAKNSQEFKSRKLEHPKVNVVRLTLDF